MIKPHASQLVQSSQPNFTKMPDSVQAVIAAYDYRARVAMTADLASPKSKFEQGLAKLVFAEILRADTRSEYAPILRALGVQSPSVEQAIAQHLTELQASIEAIRKAITSTAESALAQGHMSASDHQALHSGSSIIAKYEHAQNLIRSELAKGHMATSTQRQALAPVI